MFQGLDCVSRAVRILVGRNARLNQRLYEASGELSAALSRPDQWPPDLLRKARGVEEKLTAKGRPDKTINGMDVSTAREIAEEIFDLSIAISAASIHEMKKQVSAVPMRKGGRTRRLDFSGAT